MEDDAAMTEQERAAADAELAKLVDTIAKLSEDNCIEANVNGWSVRAVLKRGEKATARKDPQGNPVPSFTFYYLEPGHTGAYSTTGLKSRREVAVRLGLLTPKRGRQDEGLEGAKDTGGLQARVTDLEGAAHTVHIRIEELETANRELMDKVTEVEAANADLHDKAAGLEARVAELEAANAALLDKDNRLEARVADLEAKAGGFLAWMATEAEARQGNVSGAQAIELRTGALEARVGHVEARATALEAARR